MVQYEKGSQNDATGGIVGTSLARLTKRYDEWPFYEVTTMLEQEHSIQEISEQIREYALLFFARFSDLETLVKHMEQEGFFPHRKGFNTKKHNQKIIQFQHAYFQKQ